MSEHTPAIRVPIASITARQYLLLAAYNAEGMQNLGFAWALLPVLQQIHGPRGEQLGAALARHLEPVNTHPYFSAPLIGAVASLEAEGQAEQADRLKQMASGPLAAMGDQFFWVGLKPTAALLSAALILAGWHWGWLLFVALYALPQLLLRAMLVRWGRAQGRKAIARLTRANLPSWTARLALLGGAAAGALAAGTGFQLGGVPAMTALPALALSAFLIVRRGVAPLLLLYIAAGLCLLLAVVLPEGGVS